MSFFQLWVIGGGDDISNTLKTTELIDLNDGATLGPDLPWEFRYHCVAKMNTSHSIIVGGYHPTRTLIVNLVTFQMTKGPDLTGNGRGYHACAYISHNNGSNFVIAAGGRYYEDNGNHYLDTSEILNVDKVTSNGWFSGILLKETNQFTFSHMNIRARFISSYLNT